LRDERHEAELITFIVRLKKVASKQRKCTIRVLTGLYSIRQRWRNVNKQSNRVLLFAVCKSLEGRAGAACQFYTRALYVRDHADTLPKHMHIRGIAMHYLLLHSRTLRHIT